MRKANYLLLAALGMTAAGSLSAAVAVTNGDFETGGGNNIDDVTSWFDNSNGTFWQGTWVSNNGGLTPNATNVVVLGSFESGSIQNTISADVNVGNYLYQPIGTADGATSLSFSFDFGAPNDDGGGRQLGVTIGIYAFDGVGAFTAADNTDVHGAAGVSLLDSQSFGLLSTGVDGLISSVSGTLSLAGAGSQQLFLRFNNFRSANTESWPVIDNVSVSAIPEPSAFAALAGGLALGAVALRRRRA